MSNRKPGRKPSYEDLEARLAEAEQIIEALRSGQIDAIIGRERALVLRLRETEEALQRSEARLRLVVENARDGIHQLDLASERYVFMSPAQERLTGFSLAELNGMTLAETMDRLHPEDREGVQAYLDQVIAGAEPAEPMTYRWRVKSGEYRWFSDNRKLIRDDAGRPASLVGVSRDITERKQAEEALRRLTETLEQQVAERTAEVQQLARRLRALANQLSQTEQRERQHLAKILHDHIQQLIVGAKMRVEWLNQLVDRADESERLGQMTRETDDILNDVLEKTRSLTVELYPPVLESGSLAEALAWLAESMKARHQLTVKLAVDEHCAPPTVGLRILLFECARELLFNVIKHAGVREAILSLVCTAEGRLQLIVGDSGQGFDPALVKEEAEADSRFGLFSIEQRLAHLGGSVTINSAPGRGTTVTLTSPVGQPGAAFETNCPP